MILLLEYFIFELCNSCILIRKALTISVCVHEVSTVLQCAMKYSATKLYSYVYKFVIKQQDWYWYRYIQGHLILTGGDTRNVNSSLINIQHRITIKTFLFYFHINFSSCYIKIIFIEF